MHRGGDFPHVVHPGRQLQLLHLVDAEVHTGIRPAVLGVDGFGDAHGQVHHAVDVALGVGALGVDGGGDGLHEGVQQGLEPVDELGVGQGHGGLGGQGAHGLQPLLGEAHHLPGVLVLGVQELQHADDLVLVVLHGHDQHGLGAVARGLVVAARAGEVEALRAVHVVDVDVLAGQGHM